MRKKVTGSGLDALGLCNAHRRWAYYLERHHYPCLLVATSVRQHPHFSRADAVLRACVKREIEAVVHAHGLLEFHSAVTQLPGGPRGATGKRRGTSL